MIAMNKWDKWKSKGKRRDLIAKWGRGICVYKTIQFEFCEYFSFLIFILSSFGK